MFSYHTALKFILTGGFFQGCDATVLIIIIIIHPLLILIFLEAHLEKCDWPALSKQPEDSGRVVQQPNGNSSSGPRIITSFGFITHQYTHTYIISISFCIPFQCHWWDLVSDWLYCFSFKSLDQKLVQVATLLWEAPRPRGTDGTYLYIML